MRLELPRFTRAASGVGLRLAVPLPASLEASLAGTLVLVLADEAIVARRLLTDWSRGALGDRATSSVASVAGAHRILTAGYVDHAMLARCRDADREGH